jgi:lipoprotein signal peptidase
VKTAAFAVAAADLLDKLLQRTPPDLFHPRPALYVAIVLGIASALAWLVSRVGSRPLSVAAGIAVGGAVGNGISALAWRGGVPDPLVAGGFAFNLADLAALLGVASLVVVAGGLAVGRNRA